MDHMNYVVQDTKPLSVQFIATWRMYCRRRPSDSVQRAVKLWSPNSLPNNLSIRNCRWSWTQPTSTAFRKVYK